MQKYLEEQKRILSENDYRICSSALRFFEHSLHVHGTPRLEGRDRAYMQSFIEPGRGYTKYFAQVFGPEKIAEELYYYLRWFYRGDHVHASTHLTGRVPEMMRAFCEWLHAKGYVEGPIVAPFEKYQRAMVRERRQRRAPAEGKLSELIGMDALVDLDDDSSLTWH